ncbi:efflux RND transporter periplasmic adaptor subunit [Mariniblastus fucicola]|uniref:HlyD family secretion protein n=1 Tax=Mariniblastus fucicola TaxID=980251 RepID=A0A5B9P5W5_9BACT|nr:efflux RND transporter periplasmic adaptor subunit [Mariniblastus fucicola]QEG20899.1 HlyD family secretion protein [Mariniblastus fucicola]
MNAAAMQSMGDPNAQWLGAVLTLRKELRFETRTQQGKSFVIVEDPVRNKFFQIGTREFSLISAIDGSRTMGELAADIGDDSIGESFAVQVCQWLIQSNLAYSDAMDSSKRINAQAQSIAKAGLIGKLNPVSFKVKLFNPTKALDAIFPVARLAFLKPFFVVWCLVTAIGLKTIWAHWDAMGGASTGILSGYGWAWLLAFWLVLKIVHEAAHGIACRKYGGEVPEAGVLMLLFTPMAYVNVTSMWRFSSRWHRIVVAAAGMYVELFISFISVIVWSQTEGIVADTAFQLFIMSSVTTILFNANPLMRFDGYFILSDLLGVANLYPKGTRWFGDRLKSVIFGTPPTPNVIPRGEFWRCSIYGSMAFFWKLLISISLTIGASVLLPNFGVFLAAIGAAMWIGMPLYQQYQQTIGNKAKHPVSPKRLAISGCTIAAIAGLLFFVLGAPATKSAPAVVQFANETILRADSPGFIDEVFVESGSQVKQGDLLVRLRNQELLDEVTALACDVDESCIQIRIHQQADELGLARVEEEHLAGLRKQLAEKTKMAQSLEIRAPFDGFVFQRKLHNMQGQFVEQGDPMLNVARHRSKEVIVSIDQRDLDSVKENQGQELRVMISGMPVFRSRFTRVNPRATTTPTHPSLCAFAGGPLPVKASGSESEDGPSFELLSPRFTAELSLEDDISQSLHSGQRGLAFFKTGRQSMGSYLYLASCEWLRNKIELAMQVH